MTWLLLVVSLLLYSASSVTAQGDRVQDLPSSIASLAISAIPALVTLPPLNSSHPLLELSVPALANAYITLNLCSLPTGWNASSPVAPVVLVSRDSTGSGERDDTGRWTFARAGSGSRDAASGGTAAGGPNRRSAARDGQGDVWRLQWDKGFGNWTYAAEEGDVTSARFLIGLGLQTDGRVKAVDGDGNVTVQIGVSGTGPLHAVDPNPPFVSDTTSDTALVFSPLLAGSAAPLTQPSYPNYTIPALPAIPPLNASTGNLSAYSLIVAPTDSSPTASGLDNSQCAARLASNSTGGLGGAGNMVMNRTEPAWMRIGPDGPGYRVAWAVGGLQSGTNYTVWLEEGGTLSAPAWFSTKSPSFSCPLLLPTAECPGISYAAPLSLPSPTSGNGAIITSLPNTTLEILENNLASFRTSLLSQACGRDVYSHVSTCLDCHEAYRDWLCHVLVPRCADPGAPSNDSGIFDDDGQSILQAIIQRTPSPASSELGIQGVGMAGIVEQQGMSELAPCLSTCHAVERQCPAFLKFRCPHYSNGASRRYGFHGDRSASGNGDWTTGWPGVNRWGRAWCAL